MITGLLRLAHMKIQQAEEVLKADASSRRFGSKAEGDDRRLSADFVEKLPSSFLLTKVHCLR